MKMPSDYLPDGDEPPDAERTRCVLPAPIAWAALRQPVDYEDNLLGNRFLERGQGIIPYGPAGCGKSVAALQGVAEWAAGLAGLHIPPGLSVENDSPANGRFSQGHT